MFKINKRKKFYLKHGNFITSPCSNSFLHLLPALTSILRLNNFLFHLNSHRTRELGGYSIMMRIFSFSFLKVSLLNEFENNLGKALWNHAQSCELKCTHVRLAWWTRNAIKLAEIIKMEKLSLWWKIMPIKPFIRSTTAIPWEFLIKMRFLQNVRKVVRSRHESMTESHRMWWQHLVGNFHHYFIIMKLFEWLTFMCFEDIIK